MAYLSVFVIVLSIFSHSQAFLGSGSASTLICDPDVETVELVTVPSPFQPAHLKKHQHHIHTQQTQDRLICLQSSTKGRPQAIFYRELFDGTKNPECALAYLSLCQGRYTIAGPT